MHGREFPLEQPGPHDHQQGRCARVPVVREEDDSVDLSWLPSAEEHFAGLDEADQRAVLGNAGYDAWKRGDFPIDAWAKRRQNPGWRDSVVPAKPGEGGGGAIGGGDSGRGGDGGSGGTVPPVSGGGTGGPDDLARRLDEAYSPWVENLTDDQRAAIASWQGTDRHYDAIQAAWRSPDQDLSDGVSDEIQALRSAIDAGELPFDVPAWKGIRSVRRALGVSASDLENMQGHEFPYIGLFAVTIDRDVATPEFTHPPGVPAAAILRMTLQKGTRAAWISAAGDPALRAQYELLAPPQVSLKLVDVTYPDGDEGLPEISMEVIIR